MASIKESTTRTPLAGSITNLLQAARILAGKQKEDTNAGTNKNGLRDVLQARLKAAQELKLGPLDSVNTDVDQGTDPDSELDAKELEYRTGSLALALLKLLQAAESEGPRESRGFERVEGADELEGPKETKEFSFSDLPVKDQSSIRTLASIVFRWKLSREVEAFNTSKPANPDRYRRLQVLNGSTVTLLHMIFPPSASTLVTNVNIELSAEQQEKRGSESTAVGTILLHSHALDLLPAAFSLGWLPPGQCQDGAYIRASTLQVLSSFPLEEAIQMLGVTLSTPSLSLPSTARNAIQYLLIRRVMQPEGVKSLFKMTMGSEDHSGTLLERYEKISTLLSIVPRGISSNDFFSATSLQLLEILRETDSFLTYQRAAAFALAHLLSSEKMRATVSSILFPVLFDSFEENSNRSRAKVTMQIATHTPTLTPSETISVLSTFLSTSPPSTEIPLPLLLLGSIVEKLYSLLFYLESRAVSDPAECTACRGLLLSWMKVAPVDEACDRLWSIVEGHGGEWSLTILGQDGGGDEDGDEEQFQLCWRRDIDSKTLDLSKLNDLENTAMDANSLDLRPDPIHLVNMIREIKRKEVASRFFMRILMANMESQTRSLEQSQREADPTRELLRMQLLYQMQKQLPSSVLTDPTQALAFVDHAFTSTTKVSRARNSQEGLDRLRFLDQEGSHDEDNDEILRTAVDFLLSALEAHPKYIPSAHDAVVRRISAQLKTLGLNRSAALRDAAREASLILLARQSSADADSQSQSSTPGDSDPAKSSSKEIYQEALVLLQDSLLPVRAQGLAMLRHLVEASAAPAETNLSKPQPRTERSSRTTQTVNPSPYIQPLEPALIPAILDIFINSVQNEDSFIFLNAVQGLAAMVGTFGKQIFQSLMNIYVTDPMDMSTPMNRQELDVKLRVGEALNEIMGKCGQSLGGYADILIPVIFATIRNHSLPTTLRTSAISLAARCVDVAPLFMAQYNGQLAGAMLDILELEHMRLVEPISSKPASLSNSADANQSDQRANNDRSVPPPAVSQSNSKIALNKGSDTGGQGQGGQRRPESNNNNNEDDAEGDNKGKKHQDKAESGDKAVDEDPTRTNPKLSPLRRAAIHLLGAIIRRFLQRAYDTHEAYGNRALGVYEASGSGGSNASRGGQGTGIRLSNNSSISSDARPEGFEDFPARRAATILRYLALHDVDGTVRELAAETADSLVDLGRIRLGVMRG